MPGYPAGQALNDKTWEQLSQSAHEQLLLKCHTFCWKLSGVYCSYITAVPHQSLPPQQEITLVCMHLQHFHVKWNRPSLLHPVTITGVQRWYKIYCDFCGAEGIQFYASGGDTKNMCDLEVLPAHYFHSLPSQHKPFMLRTLPCSLQAVFAALPDGHLLRLCLGFVPAGAGSYAE